MPTVRAPETTAAALLSDRSDEATIQAYESVGACIVRDLISPEWIAGLRACYDDWAKAAAAPYADHDKFQDKSARRITVRDGMWRDDDRFRAFLFDSPIARAAAAVMRSGTAQLYEDLLLTEQAGVQTPLSWHQDEPTWPVSGRQLSSVWFSLEDVGPRTGAMRFVRGTHLGPLYHPKSIPLEDAGDDARYWTGGAIPDLDADEDRFTFVLTDARPGDAIIFHPRAFHSAHGSSDDHARRSFSIRFFGDDVRWVPKNHLYHGWMRDLGLKEGDRIVTERLPVVWAASTV